VTTLAALQTLIAEGDPETLELERSTSDLRRAGETLCAFLGGEGGVLLLGVGPDGKLAGPRLVGAAAREPRKGARRRCER
jgi:predicted HTH transcriptional regulator